MCIRDRSDWLQQMLLQHKPQCEPETIPNTNRDLYVEFREFLQSSTGCISEHGVECFTRLREDYINNLWSDSILEEVINIANSEQEIRSVMTLKQKLKGKHPSTLSYKSNDQEDAGTPFLHIIQCLPNLLQKFQIKGRTTWTLSLIHI